MPDPKLLITGCFSPEDLEVSVNESNRAIDPSVESKLEDLWQKKLTLAKEQGKNIYNGLSYRLNTFTQEGSKLSLDLGIFEYKVRDGLISIPEYFDLPEPYYRKGCYTCAAVKTSDNRFLLVELSGKSMNTNSIDQLGGIMETEPPVKTGQDVFDALYRELEEEGMIRREDIKEAYLKALFLERQRNVAFYFEVVLNASSQVLLERFKHESKDQDIKSLKVVTREEYLEILSQHNANKQFMAGLLSL